jgi:hypothetical protein
MEDKTIEIKLTLDAKALEDALIRKGKNPEAEPEPTENQKLAEALPPDPVVEEVKDAEWKQEPPPPPPKVGDKLPPEALNSTKFQFACNRRFVFCMDGIDAFLVKKVERPSYVKPRDSWQERKELGRFADYELLERRNAHKRLVVTLHDAISPSTRQQVEEVINVTAFPLTAQIKLLDPVGTVIGLYTYSGVEVERVDYDPLDYSDSRPDSEIKLTLSYKKERMDF